MTVDSLDYDFFGVSATYTVKGGSGATVTVVIQEEADADKVRQGTSLMHKADISVRQSEANLRPVYGSTFVLNDGNGVSQTWSIVPDGVRENRAVGDFVSEWVCDCQRFERPVP
ncbi:MAG: hypothetical protein KAT70_05260 [Thermoplasmata archaeon]|nr:hypothetical protein [Thermoplasmata archaeon]